MLSWHKHAHIVCAKNEKFKKPHQAPAVQNWVTLFTDKSLSSVANGFHLMLLVRYLHRSMFHILLPLYIHMAILSFSYIFHPLDSSLSG